MDHDGFGAGVRLHDLRRIGFRRQPADHARDAIAHVVGGVVDVAVHVELDADLGALVLAVGLDLEDSFDAGDRVLDGLRDLRFDNWRADAPRVGGRDRDNRALDVRILAHRQPLQRHEAEDHQQQADHRREDGAANRNFGDQHRRGLLAHVAAATLRRHVPSRTCCVPSMTTRSSFSKPLDDLDVARAPLADVHFAALDARCRHDEHVRATLLRDDAPPRARAARRFLTLLAARS